MNLNLNLPLYGTIPVVNSNNQVPNANVLKQIVSSASPFIQQSICNVSVLQSFWYPVPNVIRYTFKYLGNHRFLKLPPYSFNSLIANSNYSDIVFSNTNTFQNRLIGLILESPHEDEYLPSTTQMIPIAPAQNQNVTGGVIHHDILKVLARISNNQTSASIQFSKDEIIHIVILNPVPFQTSLVHIHHQSLKGHYCTLRNNIWKCIWNMPNIRSDFRSVLNSFSPNDILINCCTSQLQPILHTWLQNTLHTNPPHLLKGHHPSTLKMKGRWYQTIY